MATTKQTYHKKWSFTSNYFYFIFLEIFFQFQNLLKRVNLMYQRPKCLYSYSNYYSSSILGCFFPVSILEQLYERVYATAIRYIFPTIQIVDQIVHMYTDLYSSQSYVLDFSNANLNFLTLNARGRTRLLLKEISKQKHGKDLFSFGFKKKPPEKISNKKSRDYKRLLFLW